MYPATVLPSAYASNVTYDDAHRAGVVSLVVAGSLSGFAVLTIFAAFVTRFSNSLRSQIMPYFISLLVANLLQAIGTFMNVRWVTERAVTADSYCSTQGGLKQAGNVGMALWSFALSVHVFNILFMRIKPTKVGRCVVLVGGWAAVVFIVSIGPLAIQTKSRGPYFGPSGYWCWITDAYPREQTFLEYFFEFLSAGLSFFLYVGILLRVRGNLIHTEAGWNLRFVPRGERWQLAINRDWLDSSMLHVAARLLWYPISYITLLLPISFARLYAFGGGQTPFWATILADTLFGLQGFVNVILLFATHRLIPDPAVLPSAAPRKLLLLDTYGITPFILPPLEETAQPTITGTIASAMITASAPATPRAFWPAGRSTPAANARGNQTPRLTAMREAFWPTTQPTIQVSSPPVSGQSIPTTGDVAEFKTVPLTPPHHQQQQPHNFDQSSPRNSLDSVQSYQSTDSVTALIYSKEH